MATRLRQRLLLLPLLLSRGRVASFVLPARSQHQQCHSSSSSSSTSAAYRRPSRDTCLSGVSQKFITCSSTKELVYAINQVVQPDDRVAELGAQLRDVSKALCERSNSAVMVDVQRKFPKDAKEQRTRAMRRPTDELEFTTSEKQTSSFVEIAALDNWRAAFLKAAEHSKNNYTVFVLDVNAIVGNDLEWTTLAIMREFVSLFPTCRTVLVKSESLNQRANRIVHGQHWIEGIVNGPTISGNTSLVKSPKTICTVGVEQYRRTIARTVQPGDAVLEVGCHLGTTTTLLQQVAASGNTGGYAIGVDVGPKIVKGAQERYTDVFFSVGDAWKTADLLRIQQRYLAQRKSSSSRKIGFDVVYVDVGGLSGSDGLLEALSLLSSLLNSLEPRCIVIKSLCMLRLSSSLVPFWREQKKTR